MWNPSSAMKENNRQRGIDMGGENAQVQDTNAKIQNIREVEKSVKAMDDFTSPSVLYEELISSVKKYHPSDSVHMIEKAYQIADTAHNGQVRSRILSIRCVLPSYLRTWNLTKRRSLPGFCMMCWKIRL